MSKKKEPKQTPEEQQESTLKRWLNSLPDTRDRDQAG